MSYESIVGHAGPIARLQGIVASKRVAAAYLFAGPEGLGKRRVAEAFAALLDAEVLTVGIPEGKQKIPIESFRDENGILRKLSLKSMYSRWRVVIVDPAERLSDDAQNCLLKTLEEPPDRCLFVLVTVRPEALFPTIRSRCHTVLFTPLSEKEMRTFIEPLKLDAATADWVVALAAGSPGRATRLAGEAEELRTRAGELFDNLAAGTLNPIIERLTRIRDNEEARRRARELLDLTILALREELRSRELKDAPRPALLPDALRPRLAALDTEELADRIRELLDHLRWIDANANVGLTVENALLRI